LAPNNSGEELRGFHDIYQPYFDGQLTRCTESNGDKCGIKSKTAGLTGLVLPPATFITSAKAKPGTCAVDLCAAGPALSSQTCTDSDKQTCINKVCAADNFCCSNSWDDLCVKAAQADAECALSCGS
jgi:hypothetical protein